MKTKAIAFLFTLLVIASLVSKSDCFTGNIPSRKKGVERKLKGLEHYDFLKVVFLFWLLHWQIMRSYKFSTTAIDGKAYLTIVQDSL